MPAILYFFHKMDRFFALNSALNNGIVYRTLVGGSGCINVLGMA